MLVAGTRLGPYEIIEPIGVGGMGEVHKARDTRLNRIVAIKKSLTPFDERFEREAHTIASLNHPGICSLFDIGPDYLVMEYVDGTPLKGPLPLDEVLTLARQILDALDAAHRKEIVHRDLKPANILVTKSGVKLLDFGLAKVSADLAAGMTTIAGPATGAGAIVGTLNYMSPEQVEAKPLDARLPSDFSRILRDAGAAAIRRRSSRKFRSGPTRDSTSNCYDGSLSHYFVLSAGEQRSHDLAPRPPRTRRVVRSPRCPGISAILRDLRARSVRALREPAGATPATLCQPAPSKWRIYSSPSYRSAA
jgi:serine/threonine protein kinase